MRFVNMSDQSKIIGSYKSLPSTWFYHSKMEKSWQKKIRVSNCVDFFSIMLLTEWICKFLFLLDSWTERGRTDETGFFVIVTRFFSCNKNTVGDRCLRYTSIDWVCFGYDAIHKIWKQCPERNYAIQSNAWFTQKTSCLTWSKALDISEIHVHGFFHDGSDDSHRLIGL